MSNLLAIASCYNQPDRHYHNFTHIARMFERARVDDVKLNDAQVLAVFYHDIIYVPGSKNNERDSADLMEKLELEHIRATNADNIHWVREFEEEVRHAGAIIRDTQFEVASHPDSKNVIDLDLYELGSDSFEQDTKLIRCEFKQYNDDEFWEGRKQWIIKFLSRESIYVGFLKGSVREERARKNLQKQLKRLL